MFSGLPGSRPVLWRLAAAAALGCAALPGYGCGNDATGPPLDLTGRYELQTVDGRKLPVPIDASMWYSYSLLTLKADHSWERYDVFTADLGLIYTEADAGTYERTGEKLVEFESSTGDTFQAELSGSTIEVGSPHGLAVYRRTAGS